MAKDFNHPKVVESYDTHIRKLIPGYDLFHMQIQSILEIYIQSQQIASPRILVAGCGTGYELTYLTRLFPHATIVALDPSAQMLEYAQQRMRENGLQINVEWCIGDTQVLKGGDAAPQQKFDVVLSILVSHFIPMPEKQYFFQDLYDSLKSGGLCISVELAQLEQDMDRQVLRQMALHTGLAEAQADAMLNRLEDDFSLINIDQLKTLYQSVGYKSVHCFAQVLQYYGSLGYK